MVVHRPVDGCPHGLTHKQPHCLHHTTHRSLSHFQMKLPVQKQAVMLAEQMEESDVESVRQHHLDVVIAVQSEAVVDAFRQDNHVPLLAVDPDPLVIKVPHIKIS